VPMVNAGAAAAAAVMRRFIVELPFELPVGATYAERIDIVSNALVVAVDKLCTSADLRADTKQNLARELIGRLLKRDGGA